MFALKRPCVNCPFKKGNGSLFRLPEIRLDEIVNASAFQCHKTLSQFGEDESDRGDNPQQCAGLMGMLHNEGRENQIMQVGVRLKAFDPNHLISSESYNSIEDAKKAHLGEESN